MGLPLEMHRELPAFDDSFAEWDAADEAAVAAAHAPLPHARRQARSPFRRASASSRRAPPSGQEIFDEEEETEEDAPLDYREHPDSAEDEDTSEDVAQDEKMMSRWTSCSFFIPFLALDDKGGVKVSFMYSFGLVSTCIELMFPFRFELL